LYRRGFYPDVRPIAAMTTRLQLAQGHPPSAAEWADERGIGVDDDPDYLREYEQLTLVRLLLAEHRARRYGDHAESASPAAVLGLLDRLHSAAAGASRDGSVLEIRVLQALAHHSDGDLPQALVVLGRSFVDSPEPESYLRLYLDEGAPMLDLLRHAVREVKAVDAVQSEQAQALQEHARRLLERAEPPVTVAEQRPLADPLSPREMEVLRLLDSELTGPQIARELYVSLNTLRTHTKRIFTKLDVTTRAAAVRRAHERGLLQP